MNKLQNINDATEQAPIENNGYVANIPFEISFDPSREKNFIHLKFNDCQATLNDENGNEIGHICGTMGGGLEMTLEEDGRIFYADAATIWNAFVNMLGRDDLKYEKQAT